MQRESFALLLPPRKHVMRLLLTFLFLSSLFLQSNSLPAQEAAQSARRTEREETPANGDKAPDFQLQTLDGKTVSLSELRTKHSVVIVVLRGYPGYQCPACTEQVGSFVKAADEFARKNARVALVYPGQHKSLDNKAKEFLR